MSSIDHHIRQLAPDSLRINIWHRQGGGYQVNVSERGSGSWTVVIDDDPVAGLATALRQRATGAPSRLIEARDAYTDAPPVQCELEDAIAKAVTPKGRALMWHPESGSLFEGETFDPGDGLVEDVTNHPFYEAHFEAGTSPFAADENEDLLG